jgi:16S rRNA (uracil1498-N3)-methyltransferase
MTAWTSYCRRPWNSAWPGSSLEKRLQHWRGIVISACEQCGRATLPGLLEPMSFADWQDKADDTGLKLMLQPESRRTLRTLDTPGNGVTLLVGPEGGLTPEERTCALHTGFTGIRIGQRILRTETAGIAALAGIQALWGDFS